MTKSETTWAMSAHQELYLKPRECKHRVAIDHVTMTWKLLNFQVPRPAFYVFVLQAAKSRVGPGIKANEYMCTRWGTITHFSPPTTIVMHTHTHTVQGDCSVQWKVGLAAVQCWLSAPKDPRAKERLWGTDPTLHGQTGTATRTVIVFLLLFTISLCQLLLFAPYPWKLARRVCRSSCCDSCQTFSVDTCYSPNP